MVRCSMGAFGSRRNLALYERVNFATATAPGMPYHLIDESLATSSLNQQHYFFVEI